MAKFASLVEGFETGISGSVWGTSGAAVTWAANAGGGEARIDELATTQSIYTAGTWDLTGSHIGAKFTMPPVVNSPVWIFRVATSQSTGTDAIWFNRQNAADLQMELRTGGAAVSTLTITYNAADHAYMRISEAGGAVFWWTSPDGLTWTQRHTATAPAWGTGLTAVYARWSGVTFATPLTQYAVVDDINVTPIRRAAITPGQAAYRAGSW